MNPDVRAEKRRPSGGKQPPGRAPYSRVDQSDDRGSEKSQMTSSSKEQSGHSAYSIHQSENFPPEPGCDMSNPYYDLAVPSSSSSSYTVDSHWELLKESSRTSDELRHALHLAGWESDDIVRECGIRGWRPQCLQKLANIKAFIFCLCILSMFSGTLIAGYVNSVITTIEKRFEIGSLWSGLIAASVEIGCLVAVVFVSYLGGCRHIPVWIGCGAILQGIGALIFVLPHLLAETYTISGGITVRMNRTYTENMCRTHYSHSIHDNCHKEGSGSWWYIFILVLAQIMVGSGGSPLYTLGTTYIDDHVSPKKAPVYIAFMYATGALGPVLGFALGALMLQFYVDSFSFDTNQLNLTPSDSAWVGAWWGGFIVCGCCLLMTSVPFFAFPKVLKREKAKLVLENKENAAKFLDPEEKRRKADYGKNIKDIPRSVWRLLCNPVYMVLVIGGCCEICIVSGFCVFLPKYLETQFGISKSAANLLTGGIAIPGAVFGIMIGGYLLKRCQLGERGAIQMTIIFNIMALFGFTVLIFLGCDNVKMAGATLPYFNSSGHEIEQANLTSPCNMDCACSSNDIEPVCGINGITYFSPCHAGCTQLQSYSLHPMKMQNYSDCACIHDILPSVSNEVIMSPLATSGPCKNTCRRLLPFMVMLFVMTFLVAGAQMPLLMVTLRCVAEEERAFALGMQFVILRLFGYIPAPLLFGKIIDSSCLLWKEKCGSQGACLLYNIVHFRFKYIGVSFGLELVGAVFFVAVLALIWKKSRLLDTNNIQDETERPMSPTTISDNISVNNLSTKESADAQSPEAGAAGEKDVTDPGDLAAALLDPDESLDTASIKGVAGESCV